MGMGLYGVQAAAPRRARTGARIPRFFHRDDLNVPDVMQRVHWDPEFAAPVGQPDHVRLRPHARDVAHPPLHRLDGRRRLAVEARLRVPQVQLRRRHAVAARARSTRKYLADGDRPAVDLELEAVNQRGEVTTPGHATILLPSREHGPVRLPDPPGGARRPAGRARRHLRASSRADDRRVADRSPGRDRRRRRCCACTLDRPDKRNAHRRRDDARRSSTRSTRPAPTSACG